MRMIFLVYSIVSLFTCMVVLFPALRDIHCTSMAQYSLFVLKVPLNNNKPNQTFPSGVRDGVPAANAF